MSCFPSVQGVTYRQHHVNFTSLHVTNLCIRSHKYLYSVNTDNRANTSHCKGIQAWKAIYNFFSNTCVSPVACLPPCSALFLPGKEEYTSSGTEGFACDISQLELTVQSFSTEDIPRSQPPGLTKLSERAEETSATYYRDTQQNPSAPVDCQAGTGLQAGFNHWNSNLLIASLPLESPKARPNITKLHQSAPSISGRIHQVKLFQQHRMAAGPSQIQPLTTTCSLVRRRLWELLLPVHGQQLSTPSSHPVFLPYLITHRAAQDHSHSSSPQSSAGAGSK